MSMVAEIKLWGTTIGAVMLEDGKKIATFQYDDDFITSGIEIAPLMMPLSTQIYSFPNLSLESFHGLPGLLSDSLPDKFGNAIIQSWLASQGRSIESFKAIERLCYTGSRGMGALEFIPSNEPGLNQNSSVSVDELVKLAGKVLSKQSNFETNFKAESSKAMADILRVGTSAGGARAKAVIAWNRKTNEIRSGQVKASDGFEYWLIKFDGVKNNKDKELEDPKGYGAIEYAYYKMAKSCGINMSECRLFEENGIRHFMTRRFDRPLGNKLHMQSLAAIAHFDFNRAGVYSYEQAFDIMRRLNLPATETEELFRRMIFNVIARNQDDHVKNIAFLMDRKGIWSLSPAYDITYSYQPSGLWTSKHQMTINGKQDDFSMVDFEECGKKALLKQGQAKHIVKTVLDVVGKWRDYADEAKVSSQHREQIQKVLRLN
jgi:serine/threonine-protein kinase HipA